MELIEIRRKYAALLQERCQIQSAAVLAAFQTVAREIFAGPAPWTMYEPRKGDFKKFSTSDPKDLYSGALISLDGDKGINNGSPIINAIGIEALELSPGMKVYQVGTGGGYYTAILSDIVGKTGEVIGLEIDPHQYTNSRENLQHLANIEIKQSDASTFPIQSANAIISHAGASFPPTNWLKGLAEGGVLVFPLTYKLRDGGGTIGKYVKIKNLKGKLSTTLLTDCAFYPCIGSRNENWDSIFRNLEKHCDNEILASKINDYINQI